MKMSDAMNPKITLSALLMLVITTSCTNSHKKIHDDIGKLRDKSLQAYILGDPKDAQRLLVMHKNQVLHYYADIDRGWAENMLAMTSVRLAFTMKKNNSNYNTEPLIQSGYSHYLLYCKIRKYKPPTQKSFIEMVCRHDEALAVVMNARHRASGSENQERGNGKF